MEAHEELTARQAKYPTKHTPGDWVTVNGATARVRNRSIDANGHIEYLLDPSDGGWVPESHLKPVTHSIPFGTAVRISTPTKIIGPMGEREERDDTVYFVTNDRHFTDDGAPMYALSKEVRGMLVQTAVVSEEHLERIEGVTTEAPLSPPSDTATGASAGVMEQGA